MASPKSVRAARCLTSGDPRKSAISGKHRARGPDRSEYVIGIDPGIAGAHALVSRTGELIEVADMPILRDGSAGRASVNAPLLADLLARWHAREVICEFVTARPGEGPTGAFSFGRCRGVIEGTCAALGLPIRFVTPPVGSA